TCLLCAATVAPGRVPFCRGAGNGRRMVAGGGPGDGMLAAKQAPIDGGGDRRGGEFWLCSDCGDRALFRDQTGFLALGHAGGGGGRMPGCAIGRTAVWAAARLFRTVSGIAGGLFVAFSPAARV